MSVRKSTMAKLPSERIVNPLDIIREKSKYASKTEVLEEIYKNYCYDSKVCFNLATNKATSNEIRCKLAKHEHAEIRLEIAKKSEFIDDENVLKKLALDDYEIRKQVARSTKSESIKELLYIIRSLKNSVCWSCGITSPRTRMRTTPCPLPI